MKPSKLNTATLGALSPLPSLRSLFAISRSLLIFLLATATAFAKTPLFREETSSNVAEPTSSKNQSRQMKPDSNRWSEVVAGNPIVVPAQSTFRTIESLKPGEMYLATVSQSVLAFNDGKAPVAAKLIDPNGRDIIFLGEATLEKNSKRILVDFKTARFENSSEVFEVKASALDQDGTLGLNGEYISGESKFFLAELAAGAPCFRVVVV
jgi:hypothetical protein